MDGFEKTKQNHTEAAAALMAMAIKQMKMACTEENFDAELGIAITETLETLMEGLAQCAPRSS